MSKFFAEKCVSKALILSGACQKKAQDLTSCYQLQKLNITSFRTG